MATVADSTILEEGFHKLLAKMHRQFCCPDCLSDQAVELDFDEFTLLHLDLAVLCSVDPVADAMSRKLRAMHEEYSKIEAPPSPLESEAFVEKYGEERPKRLRGIEERLEYLAKAMR